MCTSIPPAEDKDSRVRERNLDMFCFRATLFCLYDMGYSLLRVAESTMLMECVLLANCVATTATGGL